MFKSPRLILRVLITAICWFAWSGTSAQELFLSQAGLKNNYSHNAAVDLKSGTFLCESGDAGVVKIGDCKLTISGKGQTTVVKRRALSLPSTGIKKDFFHGIKFVPDSATPSELEKAKWSSFKDERHGKEFLFTVITRGVIQVTDLTVDCNMGSQGIRKGDAVEHSAMLAASGSRYELRSGRFAGRVVYVAFRKIIFERIHFLNGGYADDIWIGRGYFRPNIDSCIFRHITSGPRVSKKRGNITFSSPAQYVEITDSKLHRIELEESNVRHWKEAPALYKFVPSLWKISDVTTDALDIASKGQSVVLNLDRVTSQNCALSDVGGFARNCSFTVLPATRFFRLKDMVFDRVNWTLLPNDSGVVKGIKLATRNGVPCKVQFINNRFDVQKGTKRGTIISSEYTRTKLEFVDARFSNCSFDQDFLRGSQSMIAIAAEKGNWKFEGLKEYEAEKIRRSQKPDVYLTINSKRKE